MTSPEGGSLDTLELSSELTGLAIAGSTYGAFVSRDSCASWAPIPQLAGPVFDIAFGSSTPNVVLVGSQSGLWRSLDAGTSWQMLPLNGWVTEVAVDPRDSRRIFALVGFDSKLLKRSLDGGQTWSNTSVHGLFGPNEIVVQPGTGAVVATTSLGVFHSSDGGANFSRVLVADVGVLARARSQPNEMLVASRAHSPATQLWRSSDGGVTWNGVASLPVDENCKWLALEPLDPAVVYAGTSPSGVWRSMDHGNSWELLQSNATTAGISALQAAPWNLAEWFASSSVGQGVLASTDPGATFVESNIGLAEKTSVFRPRTDSEGGLVALGSSRAYERKRTSDQWEALEPNVRPIHRNIVDIAIHPMQSERLWLVPGNQADLLRSVDGGKTWSSIRGPFSFGCNLLRYDFFGGLYAASEIGEFAYSADEGASWSIRPQMNSYLLEIEPDPSHPGRVHARDLFAYLRSEDYGQSWTANDTPAYVIFDLDVDPHFADVIYLLADMQIGVQKALFISLDGGRTWSQGGQGLEDIALLSIAVDPIVPGRVLVAGPGAVMQSVDGGGSFAPLAGGLDLPEIVTPHLAFDRSSPGRAYLNDEVRGSYTIDLGCPDPRAYCSAKTNSLGLQAVLRASGSPRISIADFALTVTNGVPHMPALAFASLVGPARIPLFGGLLCTTPPLQRLGVFRLDATGAATHPLQLDPSLLAQKRWYQVFYRDLAHPDGSGLAMTDGLEVLYCE